MYIQSLETPNPDTLKFIPGVEILESGSHHFVRDSDYSSSPLVKKLFDIKEVEAVFLAKDFISITKVSDITWDSIKTFVLATLVDYFVSGLPVMSDDKNSKKLDYSEIEKQIVSIIDEKIRPAVAQDGGDIVYKRFSDGVVYVELQGACSGCPSSTVTLKHGIENMLMHYVPEVKAVESI